MRIAFTSDLHTDHHAANRVAWQAMVALLYAAPPDVFVCCGDIAADAQQFGTTLLALEHLPCVKLLVPGNHDLWIHDLRWVRRGVTSREKYYTLLPALCRAAGFHPLWLQPCVVGKVAFCGTMGWYDYSLRNVAFDTQLSHRDYRRKRFQERVWSDGRFVFWPAPSANGVRLRRLPDEVLAAQLTQEFAQQLLQARQQAPHIVAVTHMVPFRAMIHYYQEIRIDYFHAFMGSEALGEVLQHVPEVVLTLVGHTHRQLTVHVAHMAAQTSPLGYSWQWQGKTPHEMARERLTFIDIPTD